jgi:hypothetical protein
VRKIWKKIYVSMEIDIRYPSFIFHHIYCWNFFFFCWFWHFNSMNHTYTHIYIHKKKERRRKKNLLQISRRHLSANHSMMLICRFNVLCTTWKWIKKLLFLYSSIFFVENESKKKAFSHVLQIFAYSTLKNTVKTARYLTPLDLFKILNISSADVRWPL